MDSETAAVKEEGPAGVKAEQPDATASTVPADTRWGRALKGCTSQHDTVDCSACSREA